MTQATNSKTTISTLIGLSLVGVGILILLIQRLGDFDASNIWPFFIIVPGLALLLASFFGGIGGQYGAVMGSVVTIVGLLLLYQDAFQHFESWAYGWALVYPTAFGIGWLIYGASRHDHARAQQGRKYVLIGLAMFFVGLIIFELIIGISDKAVFALLRNSTVWPILLIVVGGILALWGPGRGQSGLNIRSFGRPSDPDES